MSATILLVDYDPRSIARIRGVLAPFGARIVLATDGHSAVRKFDLWRPDLTLIQDLIPRRHGYELCKELKTTEHGRTHAVILVAFRRSGNGRTLRATLCDDVLEKPFDDVTLVDKVLRFLPEDSLSFATQPTESAPVVVIEDPREASAQPSALFVLTAEPGISERDDPGPSPAGTPRSGGDSDIEIEIVLEPYAEYPPEEPEVPSRTPSRSGRRLKNGRPPRPRGRIDVRGLTEGGDS